MLTSGWREIEEPRLLSLAVVLMLHSTWFQFGIGGKPTIDLGRELAKNSRGIVGASTYAISAGKKMVVRRRYST